MKHRTSLGIMGVSSAVTSALRAWGGVSAVMLGAAMPWAASAGVSDVIDTVVTPLAGQATYSSVTGVSVPLKTYLGFKIETAYSGRNTTNNVVLQGELKVTDPAELPGLVPVTLPDGCQVSPLADSIQLVCDLGQFRAGDAPKSVLVIFTAPERVGNGVADGAGEDLVTLTGVTFYAEGADNGVTPNDDAAWRGGEPGSEPQGIVLGTVVSGDIKSLVPRLDTEDRSLLYSGQAGIARPGDPLAVSVGIPNLVRAGVPYAFASIVESEVLSCLNSPLVDGKCLELVLDVKDSAEGGNVITFPADGQPLSVRFSVDKDQCPRASCKLNELGFKYEGVLVEQCVNGLPRTDGIPCLNGAPQRVKDPKNKDRDGDVEAEALNFRNGRFTVGPL